MEKMKEKGKINILKLSITASMSASLLTLSGCAAIGTAIKHRNLEVSSKTSESIFLDPVSSSDKTVYIQVKSTLTEDFKGLKEILAQDLQNNGWQVVNDIDKAHAVFG